MTKTETLAVPISDPTPPLAPASERTRSGSWATRTLIFGVLRRPTAAVSLIILLAVVVACLAAPWIAPYEPNQQDLATGLTGPTSSHWLGTDQLGRDTLARLLYGGRVSLYYAAVVAVVALLVGIVVGMVSGYLGGWVDRTVMFVSDIGLAIPVLVVVIVVLSVLREHFVMAMAVLGVLMVPPIARSVRAPVLAVRSELFVDAARVSGLSTPRILVRHVLPRVAGPVLVQATLVSALALQLSVGLAYLGFGPEPPDPTWGSMVAQGAELLMSNRWLLMVSGGIVTVVTVCLGLIGDAVRDSTVQAWTGDISAATSRRRRRAVAPAEPVPTAVAPTLEEDRDASGQLLAVEGLSIAVERAGRQLLVAQGVSFSIAPGETVGLVGESGCGKTSVARSLIRLLSPGGSIVGGTVRFQGRDVLGMSNSQLAQYRAGDVGFVAQEPMATLDPTLRVGTLLTQVVRARTGLSRAAARARVLELLDMVHLPDPAGVARKYPHQLSGGMAQRVAIARAIAGDPKLLIADEPTTALDVTVQAKILNLLEELQQRMGLAVLLVSHDWAVVNRLCDRALVMYAGELVEQGPTQDLVALPAHPYTAALLGCLPGEAADKGTALATIPGQVPAPGSWLGGCRFAPRCELRVAACLKGPIEFETVAPQHVSRCLRTEDVTLAEGGQA